MIVVIDSIIPIFIHIKAFMAQSGIRTTPEQVMDFDKDTLKGKDTLNL